MKILKDPKFEVGDHVRISKYKNIFAKCYTANWSEEVFLTKNVLLVTYTVKKVPKRLMKKNRKRQIKKILEFKK